MNNMNKLRFTTSTAMKKITRTTLYKLFVLLIESQAQLLAIQKVFKVIKTEENKWF